MDFQTFKSLKLQYLDQHLSQSRVDIGMIPLINFLNQNQHFVTSSSCYGRISLLELSKGKKDASFFRKWHRTIDINEFTNALNKYLSDNSENPEKTLWFRCEPFILHVFADSLDSANYLLSICKRAGLKRAGIVNASFPFMLEIIGTNEFSFPLVHNTKVTLKQSAFSSIVQQANTTIKRNFKQVSRFIFELKHKS